MELKKTGRHSVKRVLENFSPTQVRDEDLVAAKTSMSSVEDHMSVCLVSPILYSFYSWSFALMLQLDKQWTEKNLLFEENASLPSHDAAESKEKRKTRVRKKLRSAAKKATLF